MDTAIFNKFDEMFGVDGLVELQRDIDEAASGNVERKEVPFGDYEVRITKLELGENTYADGDYFGMPELHVWFKIISEGEYKNQMLFMNKRLVSLKNPKANGFLIRNVSEFLESLESGTPIVFENFNQYGSMIESIFNEIDGRAEYQLAYFENKGFKDYTIVKRFQ